MWPRTGLSKIIFIVISLCVHFSKCLNDFLIVRHYESGEFYCITNTSYALSWILEDVSSDTDLQQESKFLSKRQSFWKISNDDMKSGKWEYKKSFSEEIILDRRWESMKVYKTEFPKYDKTNPYPPLEFTTVVETLESNFEIPLSIRIQNEAHVFLCDGKNVTESSCYWIIMQGFGGTKTVIRKCAPNSIPSVDNLRTGSFCYKNMIEKIHTNSDTPIFLYNKTWNHFKILKNQNRISLTNVNNYEIISFTDPESVFNLTHMFIHSKHQKGLWKLHELEYFYTKEAKRTQLQPKINPINGSICVSMFVKQCKSCEIELEITNLNDEKKYLKKGLPKMEVNSGWREIEFTIESHYTEYSLALITENKNDKNPFWKIGDIRQCSKPGFRMIRLKEPARCQLISSGNNIIAENNEVTTSQTERCGVDTVGRQCVPCSLFVGEKCGRLKICEKSDNILTCSCSAGFKAEETLIDCDFICGKGKYGHQCKNECSPHCHNNCNYVDGTCGKCTGSYGGTKCDIPPIYFKQPPKVSDYSYTTARIFVSSFETSVDISTNDEKYVIQYKRTESNTQEWTSTKEIYKFGEKRSVDILNLEPGTAYSARCVIVRDNEFYAHEGIPQEDFTTRCDAISDKDIEVKPSNITAVVSLIVSDKNQNRVCRFKNPQLKLNETIIYKFHFDRTYIVLEDLEAFQFYEISITEQTSVIKKLFRTTEGIPDKVSGLNSDRSSTGVLLSWKRPRQVRGELKHYSVKYQIIRYQACPENCMPIIVIRTVDTENTTISDLLPYTTYSFFVTAVNAKFEGPSAEVTENIPESDSISDFEIPEFHLNKLENRFVELLFSSVNCTKIRGTFMIMLDVLCKNEWCKNLTREAHHDRKGWYKLDSLVPFSNYSLKLKVCRNANTCRSSDKSINFQTKIETPNHVRSLTVYSKNENSLSLRWSPPYPPNGILELYKITYYLCTDPSNSTSTSVSPNPCFLWPEYHCFTLGNLLTDAEYCADVIAKNELLEQFGQLTSRRGTTKIEPSKPSPDLSITWTFENDLEITWKHPTEANGDITNFNISVLSKNNQNNNIRTNLPLIKNNYKPIYRQTIEAKKLLPSTEYKLVVRAYNGIDGDESSLVDTSPPEIPLFEMSPIFSVSKNTIQVKTPKIRNLKESHSYRLFLLVRNNEINVGPHPEILKRLEEKFGITTSKFKIAHQCDYSKRERDSTDKCKNHFNSSLTSDESVENVTIVLVHTHGDKSSFKLYTYDFKEVQDTPKDLSLLALLSLLLIIPLGIIIFVKRHYITEKFSSVKKDTLGERSVDTEAPDEQIPFTTSAKNTELENAKIYSEKIQISDFENYVKESLKSGQLERQHGLFPRGQTKPWDCGALKENKSKNRYTNLVAYDHTRVVLAKIKGQEYSDYINANYIDGYNVPKAYIATQGPKLATISDFWRMIWQENVQHIAMLANIFEGGKKKVEKYWPEQNETLPFGKISVKFISSEVFADYEHRIFKMVNGGESRIVHQYHFSSWPDHGVPLYSQSLVPFLQNLQNIPRDAKSPIVVHCSAGVGRTGTVILCDSCLRMAAREKVVDVLRTLQELREQRPNMVDNPQQYKLAHLVILEYLLGMKTSIPCSKINTQVDELIKSGEIKSQMKYLTESAWQDQTMKSTVQKSGPLVIVKEKNRFQTIVPEIQGCVFLSRFPPEDDASTYINAIRVDGFQSPDRYLVTQQPMPNTLTDFWRLIHEKNVSVVISLNEINLKNRTCCPFWPSQETKILKPVDYISLEHSSTRSLESYELTIIHMHVENDEEYRTVEIISLKGWPAKTSCPKSVETFLSFWEETEAISRKSNPLVVTCFDGAVASGLYLAMSFMIEKMKLEQMCDVCQAARTIRHNRSQFVQSEEQFEFLYRAALAYIDEFQSYANFN